MKIVKVSPKGQITLPKDMREKFDVSAFAVDVTDTNIILQPLSVSHDELDEFSALGVSAFSFWDNSEDDIYDEFYKDIPSL